MLARELKLSCALLVSLGLHINFSKFDLYLTQQFSFLSQCWNTVDMSVFLPSDKLNEIQQMAHSLLQNQSVTVHDIMFILGKNTFFASGHTQHCQLCYVIQSDMFITILLIYFFFPFSL